MNGTKGAKGFIPIHGARNTRAYRIWCGMRTRCLNPNRVDFHRYGGRGIGICEAWADFRVFLADMGAPAEGHTLDRIDNDAGYGPTNCRWATRKEQRLNNSQNIRVSYNGAAMTLAEACVIAGKKHNTVYMRMRRGANFQEAIK